MKELKGILLDAEGTFLHIYPSVGHVYSYILQKHGYKTDPQQINKAFFKIWQKEQTRKKETISRESNYQFWKNIFLNATNEVVKLEDPEMVFEECYNEFSKKKWWQLAPNFLEALKTWNQEGLKIAVVSNWDERLIKLLDEFNIRDLFHALIISTEVGLEKPDPEIIKLACKKIDIEPSQAVMIGDNLDLDYEAAKAAGCAGLIYDPKQRYPDIKQTISDFKEIKNKKLLLTACSQ